MIVLVCVIAISDTTDYIHEANASQTTNHINEITSAFMERYISFNIIQALCIIMSTWCQLTDCINNTTWVCKKLACLKVHQIIVFRQQVFYKSTVQWKIFLRKYFHFAYKNQICFQHRYVFSQADQEWDYFISLRKRIEVDHSISFQRSSKNFPETFSNTFAVKTTVKWILSSKSTNILILKNKQKIMILDRLSPKH